MAEREHRVAGRAGTAGLAAGRGLFAQKSLGKEESGPRLPHPGGAVEEVGVPDVTGMNGGSEEA